jgi:alkaline phosphatase D
VDGELRRELAPVSGPRRRPGHVLATLSPVPGRHAPLNRRSFLAGSASFAAAALFSTRARGATAAVPKFSAYPFSLGVASGDPAPDGVVLWTRLAPRPREPGGGMPPDPVEVSWQMAEDEAMTRVVRRGTATANRRTGRTPCTSRSTACAPIAGTGISSRPAAR